MGKKSREKQDRGDSAIAVEKPENNSSKILKTIIFIGTCFILFTPFVINSSYFFPFVGIKSLYFMGLVEIIFAAWLILIVSDSKYRPKLNLILAVLTVFLLVNILSSVLGADFSRSFWSKFERMTGLLMQFHLFAFFLVVSTVFKKKEDWLKIFAVSVFAAVVMSIITLLSNAGVDAIGSLTSADRQGGTLGNSSFLGTYLLFNFFFCFYVFFNTKLRIKILSAGAAALIFIALYFSTARAALASTVGGAFLVVLLWLLFANAGKRRLVGIALLVISVIGFFAGTYLAVTPGNFVHDKIVAQQIGPTFGGRYVVWEAAWKGFLEKPFLGWGPENFELVFTKYYNPCLGNSVCGGDVWYDRAHNVVFDTLASLGGIGLLAYLGIFFAAFYVLWRKFFKQVIGFWPAALLTAILIAYFVQNLTVFDMINSYMLFFLILGFLGSIAAVKETRQEEENNEGGDNESNENNAKPVKLLTVAVVIIIFILPFVKFVIQPWQADREIIVALNYPPGSQQRLAAYQETLNETQLGKYQIRDFFAQTTLQDIQSSGNLTQAQAQSVKGELNFLIQETGKTIQESPWDFRAYLKLGQLYDTYAVLIDPTKLILAENAYQDAIVLSPENQQAYWGLAQTDLYMGQQDEALSLTEKALALDPTSEQSNLIVIQVAKIMGNDQLAQQKAAAALKVNPAWATDVASVLGNPTSPVASSSNSSATSSATSSASSQ